MPNDIPDFFEEITPELARTEQEAEEAEWAMTVCATDDNRRRLASAKLEYCSARSNPETFTRIKALKKTDGLTVGHRRMLNILYHEFAPNQLNPTLLSEMSAKEAELQGLFASFRPAVAGKIFSDNEILDILANEKDHNLRLAAWEASKQIGIIAAPKILELVTLRNRGALELGYKNYYVMSLAMQDINPRWLSKFFDKTLRQSSYPYKQASYDIALHLSTKFNLPTFYIGPQFWSDPFGQEDPIKGVGAEALFEGKDIIGMVRDYYHGIGFQNEFDDILSRSDLYERENKNPSACCCSVDRGNDVRVMMNAKNSPYWFRVGLHEFGHGMAYRGIDRKLPWTLRQQTHIMAAEAIALFFEKVSRNTAYLQKIFGQGNDKIYAEMANSGARQRIIFSRWASVMTKFESELYANPGRDLNTLWWSLVRDIQGIKPPKRPENVADWAAKAHIALAPIYYHNYLLGDIISEQLSAAARVALPGWFEDKSLGNFLKKRWFRHGAALKWSELIRSATGKPLSAKDWLNSFTHFAPTNP